jgi:hypothetical protein
MFHFIPKSYAAILQRPAGRRCGGGANSSDGAGLQSNGASQVTPTPDPSLPSRQRPRLLDQLARIVIAGGDDAAHHAGERSTRVSARVSMSEIATMSWRTRYSRSVPSTASCWPSATRRAR